MEEIWSYKKTFETVYELFLNGYFKTKTVLSWVSNTKPVF